MCVIRSTTIYILFASLFENTDRRRRSNRETILFYRPAVLVSSLGPSPPATDAAGQREILRSPVAGGFAL